MNAQAPIWNAKFKQRLLRVALGVLDSPGLAEEVVQEAYLRFLETESGSIENPSQWLCKVTRNLSIDRARRLICERELLLLLPGLDLSGPGDEQYEIEDRLAELIASLLYVSDLQATSIVLLHVVFGVPYDDIASICDRSPSACRQVASRALRKCFDSTKPDIPFDEFAEATIFAHAILDASTTPFVESLGGALTINSISAFAGCSTTHEIRTVIKAGEIKQALMLKASGIQWVLIHDGRVLCVLGNTARLAALVTQ